MRRNTHPVEMVDSFLKEAAAALPKPYGVGDAARSMGPRPRVRLTYSKPNPPVEGTKPGLVSSQKAVPPPPVA